MTRYADDFVIVAVQKEGERVFRQITNLLEQELGLKVHPTKTKIVDHQEESFVFLHKGIPVYRKSL